MLKELKESMIKEVTEGMMITFYHVQNVYKDIEIIKKGAKWNFWSWKVKYLKWNLYMNIQSNIIYNN